jgi:hypothetical protein
MTTREFFIEQFRSERPKFVNVLRALPEGKLDYRPHERSSSAAMIAWFLVLELRALVDMIRTREIGGSSRRHQRRPPPSLTNMRRRLARWTWLSHRRTPQRGKKTRACTSARG